MAANVGKKFESAIQKAVPKETAIMYRLPDSAQSFGGSSRLRFSRKNPFDFILWDSIGRNLYALELKTVKGKSISFERSKEESGQIHYHQICGLNEWSQYSGTICGFIIEFREIETTIFLSITEFNKLSAEIPKKSFTLNNLEEGCFDFVIIEQEKKKTQYRYDVAGFLEKMRTTSLPLKESEETEWKESK